MCYIGGVEYCTQSLSIHSHCTIIENCSAIVLTATVDSSASLSLLHYYEELFSSIEETKAIELCTGNPLFISPATPFCLHQTIELKRHHTATSALYIHLQVSDCGAPWPEVCAISTGKGNLKGGAVLEYL